MMRRLFRDLLSVWVTRVVLELLRCIISLDGNEAHGQITHIEWPRLEPLQLGNMSLRPPQ